MAYFFLRWLQFLCLGNCALSRNPLYPPLLYAGTWFPSIAGLALSGDAIYPVSRTILAVYAVGATLFTAGGALVHFTIPKKAEIVQYPFARRRRLHTILDVLLLVIIYGFLSRVSFGQWIAEVTEHG